ncbi:MAG: sulfatase-like hydrolase/transferase, partial [Gammaproteobacteria bacterium]
MSGEAPGNSVPISETTPPPAMTRGIRAAASVFLDWLPALVLALACLRGAELVAGMTPNAAGGDIANATARAIIQDLWSLFRYLPGLYLCALPLLLLRSRRVAFYAIGFAWSLLVIAQAALVQYFLTARVPLGADLYAYSRHEIRTTVGGGAGLNTAVLLGLTLALVALWYVLTRQSRRPLPLFPPNAAALVLVLALLVLVAAPRRPGHSPPQTEDAYNLSLNKTAYFIDDSVAWLAAGAIRARPVSAALAEQTTTGSPGFQYLDPQYPFLRTEQTPDVLGPHFAIRAGQPPNLVIIIIEGLGRSFSGPNANLGSFTPQLDLLAARSLYWENFLAPQGRTFAALSTILAALPFGDRGFAMLGKQMPAHTSLPAILKRQGYRLKFYCGTDLDFDNERLFLQKQRMDVLVGQDDFGPEFRRSG